MEVYFLRHAETEYNRQHRFMGTLDLPVCDDALLKIQKLEFLPDIVYVSPLKRTQQTAKALLPKAKQIIINGFKEMNFGEFEGVCYAENTQNNEFKAWLDGGCVSKTPNGESRHEFMERAAKAFDEIVLENIAQNNNQIFIVAHGGTQMAVLSQFAAPPRPYESWCAKNVGGFILTLNEKTWLKERKLNVIDEVCYSL